MNTDVIRYHKDLVKANGRKPAGRKVWSIDLESVWLPYFTAANVVGHTAMPHESLGAPLRLAYNPDGSVKFSKTGKPVIRVAKDLSDAIRLVRENFTAGLMAFSNAVVTENPEGYKAQVTMAREAGEPITSRDRANLSDAMNKAIAEAIASSEAKAEAEAEKPKRERKPKTEPVKELVTA